MKGQKTLILCSGIFGCKGGLEPGLVYAQMPIVRPTLQCTQQMFLEEREM